MNWKENELSSDKGFKQGVKASITSAIQSMMRIGHGSTLGPRFSLLVLFTDILHLLAARVCDCHNETFNFTGKSSKQEMVTKPASWAANKARTPIEAHSSTNCDIPAKQGHSTASLSLKSIFLKQEVNESKA